MKVDRYYRDDQIQLRYFDKMAKSCQFPVSEIRNIIFKMASEIADKSESVAQEMRDSGVSHSIIDELVDTLKLRSKKVLK